MEDTGFAPNTPVEVGIARFVDWYRQYYRVDKELSRYV
jgi:UDP-glucuronate 4-epimerase